MAEDKDPPLQRRRTIMVVARGEMAAAEIGGRGTRWQRRLQGGEDGSVAAAVKVGGAAA